MSLPTEPLTQISTLIRSDRAGRARNTPEFRQHVLAAYDASGMTGPAFAEHCGVTYPTLASWLRRRDRSEEDGPRFILAELPSPPPEEGTLTVMLHCGATAEISGPVQVGLLARLLKELR